MGRVDLRAGAHYAYRSAGSDRPSRVEVTGLGQDRSVPVFVHVARGPRSHGDRRLAPGSTIQVPVLHLISTWDEWLASAEGAADRALPQGSPELLPDRMLPTRPDRVPDPDRPLPAGYSNLGPQSRPVAGVTDLPDHAAAQLATSPEALLRWTIGLPLAVVRDIAAAAGRRGVPSPPGSVGAVLSRSGALLATLLSRHDNLIDLFPTVNAADAAFTETHTASAKTAPWSPRLPGLVFGLWARVSDGEPPGWLRVGMRAVDGSLHRPDCVLAATTYGTAPLWRALLSGPRPCRGCGGGGLVPHPSLLAFTAASDVWQARGVVGMGERWQQVAHANAVAFAAAEQTRIGRADQGDPVAGLLALPPVADSDQTTAWASELLIASSAWRRLSDVDKNAVTATVANRLSEAGQVLGVDPPEAGADEDRAEAARRVRHWLHILAVRAAVPDAVMAAMLGY